MKQEAIYARQSVDKVIPAESSIRNGRQVGDISESE